MSRTCEVCGKGIQRGHKVSHAKQRTKKIFKPNLQTVRLIINGRKKKIKVCTKCLRTLKKKQQQSFKQVRPVKKKAEFKSLGV